MGNIYMQIFGSQSKNSSSSLVEDAQLRLYMNIKIKHTGVVKCIRAF